MMRLPRRPLVSLTLVGLVAAAFGSPAEAQYRPPPLTEAQRLVKAGDEAQVEASRAVADNERAEAEQAYRKALGLYDQALKLDPTSLPAAAGYGAAGSALQDYARVVERLRPLALEGEEALDAVFPLAVSLFKLRRFAEAVPLLERVCQVGRAEHLVAYYYLGNFYLYEQRGDEAVRTFNRYLQLRPAPLAANDFQIHELIGRAWLLGGRSGEARAAFSRALALRPDAVGALLGIASVLELEGKGAEARAQLESLVQRFPRVAEPKERLARMMLASGALPRAEALALELVKLGSTPAAHLLLGDVRLAQKQPGPAEAEFRKVLQLSPGLVLGQIAIGRSLQMQGRNEEAIAFLESAVRGGASSVELWATLGSVNRRAGRFQRAIEVHRRVVEMVPRRALGHALLGADHYATGQWDQAIEDYANALQVEPQHAESRTWLARALAQRARERARAGRLEDATRDLRRAFDLERVAPMARRLGAALLAQKAWGPAVTVLTQGVALPQVTWREHFLLGYAQLGAQQAAQALSAFEQAARMTQGVDALSDIYVGWSLAKVELGDFDTAVSKLMEPGQSVGAAQLSAAYLPTALLRRGLKALEAGDVAGARKDLENAERLPAAKQPDVVRLSGFLRGLLQVEDGHFAGASASLRKALAPGAKWAAANARSAAETYVLFRKGEMPRARKALAALARRAPAFQADWFASLSRAIDRGEGERAYAAGNLKLAERALKAASEDDPLNPLVQHNLACVAYRKGRRAEAVAVWERVEAAVPQAALNLGIDAHERRASAPEAVAFYRRYLATGGPRSALVRDWKERLQSLHGIADPAPPPRGPSPAPAAATEVVP